MTTKRASLASPLDKTKPRQTLAKLFGFLWASFERPQVIRIAIAVIALIGAKLASLVVPFLLGRLVGVVAEQVGDLFAVMGGLILAYVAMRFTQVLFTELKDSIFINVVQISIRRLAKKVFTHLHSLSLEFHHSRQTGGLALLIERGTKGIEWIVSTFIFSFVPTFIELGAVCLIFLGLYGWEYAVTMLVTIIAYAIATVTISQWRRQFRKRLNDANEISSTRAVDSLINHETVKLFSAQEREIAKYDQNLKAYEKIAIKTQWSLSLLNLVQAVIITAGLGTLLLLAARDTVAAGLDAGDIATINAYLLQMFLPLGFLGTFYRIIADAIINIEKCFVLLAEPTSTPDKPDAKPLKVDAGAINFDQVSLKLGGRQILAEVSFTVPAKKRYALVGETGSGKTTITRLLARLLDPDSGTIKIDHQDIREVTQLSVRAAMGFVAQDVVMFNDTFLLNLTFGKPDATQAQIEAALTTAGLNEFVARLPEGLQTQVGERGVKLSGGERQRLAIARAILLEPTIMVMDEATSALDAPTESRIKVAMESATSGRTTLLIAHRLATVTTCDCIIVLDNGKIVEQGTHAELLELDGHYAQSWYMQSRNPQN